MAKDKTAGDEPEAVESPKLIPVTFIKGWSMYIVGDVAGFPQATVDELIKTGIAEAYKAKKGE